MNIKQELKKPRMPNFIRLENGNTVDVKHLTLDQAREYAEWMKEEFIGHWNDKQGVIDKL